MLLTTTQTDRTPREFVAQLGEVFAVFDAATQDSGNVSYGVRVGEERFFVKTAGEPGDSRPFLAHGERVELLRNAIRLAGSVTDPALPLLRNVVESAEGPLLVYDWVEGELLRVNQASRTDPASAFARFRALPAEEIVAALDVVFRLHVKLAQKGWIACDFYDGCLIYDFARRRLSVVDLDTYRDAPFVNRMGRMFGSTRFMAPEEHELGAGIDERTTVFTLGRTLEQLFPAASAAFVAVASRACEHEPSRRWSTVAAFYEAWTLAVEAS